MRCRRPAALRPGEMTTARQRRAWRAVGGVGRVSAGHHPTASPPFCSIHSAKLGRERYQALIVSA
jgi:hypothetical protein